MIAKFSASETFSEVDLSPIVTSAGLLIDKLLIDMFGLRDNAPQNSERSNMAREEASVAIGVVRNGAKHADLKPQRASVRRRQHELIKRANLVSHSYGKEPNRHVRVFRR